MAAITAYTQLTLMEAMKREGFDDLAASLGELAQMIDVLDVMPWKPATHGIYNKQFQASRLGTGSFSRTGGYAIPSISSSGELIEEPVKIYEGLSQIDERLLQGVDDPAAVRDSEDGLNMEGAFQDWAYNLFYGVDGTSPDNFNSFASRRPAITGYAPYVVSGGGATALTSAWLLELSPDTLYLAYPANSGTPGFKNEDRGRLPITALVGTGMYFAWTRLYQIWAAIVMRNARALIRYCNIESGGTAHSFVVRDFIHYCKSQLQNMGRNSFIFVNRYVKGQIESGAYSDTMNGALTVQAIEGYGPVTFVAGIPLRMHEGITIAETALV